MLLGMRLIPPPHVRVYPSSLEAADATDTPNSPSHVESGKESQSQPLDRHDQLHRAEEAANRFEWESLE